MQSTSNAPGKGFLKVTGIIMIVFGAVLVVMMALAMLGVKFEKDIMNSLNLSNSMLWWSRIASLVTGLALLITGIIGVKFCDMPQKATVCLVFAIICLVFSGVTVTTASGYIWSPIGEFGGGAGVALPILYLIGAILNKRAAKS